MDFGFSSSWQPHNRIVNNNTKDFNGFICLIIIQAVRPINAVPLPNYFNIDSSYLHGPIMFLFACRRNHRHGINFLFRIFFLEYRFQVLCQNILAVFFGHIDYLLLARVSYCIVRTRVQIEYPCYRVFLINVLIVNEIPFVCRSVLKREYAQFIGNV